MERQFNASYVPTDSKFYIKGIEANVVENDYLPFVYVLMNILQRGCPTRLSAYLEKHLLIDEKSFTPLVDEVEINEELMDDNHLAVAVMRYELVILSLLESGYLSFEDDKWTLYIKDPYTKDAVHLAYQDVFEWIKHLCQLAKVDFRPPTVTIVNVDDIDSFDDGIYIDFNLFKDDDTNKDHVIYVRNAIDDEDYFQIHSTDPITYNIQQGNEHDEEALRYILKSLFGFDNFNDGQMPIIINSLNGNHTVGLLPTGQGKSLCYQMVALLQPAVSFVVAPIKSLMYDQIYNLRKKQITRCDLICSDQTPKEQEEILNRFADGELMFVIVSPERFQSKTFREYLVELRETRRIAYAVIDEVHCLSEWGHDFRTSYLHLCNTIRRFCPEAKFLGLTATASVHVLNDILREFQTDRRNVKTLLEYSRPELQFQVINTQAKESTLYKLLDFLQLKQGVFDLNGEASKCGIIFTLTKSGDRGCYMLSKRLRLRYGADILLYSVDIPEVRIRKGPNGRVRVMERHEFDQYKLNVQQDFQDNRFPLLVSTKAFGMGIDKSNIRYTIHYGLPGSLEALYQEAGRAGRDRKKAYCYVLYSPDQLNEKDYQKLFSLQSTVADIESVIHRIHYNKRQDILRNLSLWTLSNKGISIESNLPYFIVLRYGKPRSYVYLKTKQISEELKGKSDYFGRFISFNDVQKAIYRLSLLGIVEDWTVEDWFNNEIEVKFTDYNDETIYESLLSYIRKYDVSFDFEHPNYYKYQQLFEDDQYTFLLRCLLVLNQWIYDNIFYHRRQSLQTLVELCENFQGKEAFKQAIEAYFQFTDDTNILEHITTNPDDVHRWFEVFYTGDERKELKNHEEIRDLEMSLQRFLESYQYNVGLNFMSGMIALILDRFDERERRDRLTNTFETIKSYDDEMKAYILKETLRLGQLMNPTNRQFLSMYLCTCYPVSRDIYTIYQALKDNHSLQLMIKDVTKRLKKVRDYLHD